MGPKTNSKQSKNANKKGKQSDSYLADDKNYDSFSAQLVKLGLELRDITGDGNCCFRALSDQINGDETIHLDIRRRVCDYMLRNRDEFEPFVAALIDESDDDDNKKNKKTSHKNMDAFELYIKNLEKPGTYADNGVLVAFARLYNYDINIHQLDLPIWTISSGITKKNQPVRQLHLSYHNGEHYSSIRPKGDRTNNPTNIVVNDNNNNNKASNDASKNGYDYLNESNYYEPDIEEFNLNQELSKLSVDTINNLNVEQIIDSTDCHDVNLIQEMLKKNDNDVTLTIGSLLSQMQLEIDDKKETKSRPGSKQVKIDKKKDKKMRQMERQRNKLLEEKQADATSKKDVKTNQIIETHSAPETTEFNVLLNNIEKKSI